MKQEDDSQWLDPDFLKLGMKVYTNEFAQKIREENLEAKIKGKKIKNMIPQEGFQERVCLADADLVICGGKKGGGKEQPYSSRVLMADGSFGRMGGLRVGDLIADRYGKPQQVLQIFEQGVKDIYEITTNCGTCKCGEFHLWTTYIKGLDTWMVLTTMELIRLIGSGYDLYLPMFGSNTALNKIWCISTNGEKEQCRCILVSSADHLYITDNFIVTHNSWVALYKMLPYMFNPDVSAYAFRKYEDDVKRGPWKSCRPIFRPFATLKESTYEASFLDGKGATMKMEHLADQGKITDRFRGAEMAYIDLEELPEHTRESLDIIFDFLAVNRNTAGVKSQMVCTCNPVGWKNKLRKFLEWYIDPETDTIIPERDGKVRYMFKYGADDSEIAWGNSVEEVYANPKAKQKIDLLLMGRDDITVNDMVLSVQFIEGDYADNKILQATDKKYVSRLASKGDGSVVNDLTGVWRDIDEGSGLLTMEEMQKFFDNSEQLGDGIRRASCDVALVGDFFVIFAAEGRHIIDMDAWFGEMSDSVIPFIEHFLQKNGVKKRNFTFDSNGLGVWLSQSTAFRESKPFNNKSAPSDNKLWNNLKSESAEKWVKEIKMGMWSIESSLLYRKFTDVKGHTFTLGDRLMEERLALRRKDDTGARFEIISKQQMKLEVGHSPDFIEALIMFAPLYEVQQNQVRKGFKGIWW